MDWLHELARDFLLTCRDILPIVLLFGFFQLVVLRRRVANLGTILAGTVYVVIGLTLFLLGLEKALIPLGTVMALMMSAVRDTGAGLLLVSHNPGYGDLADRVLRLEGGQLVELKGRRHG